LPTSASIALRAATSAIPACCKRLISESPGRAVMVSVAVSRGGGSSLTRDNGLKGIASSRNAIVGDAVGSSSGSDSGGPGAGNLARAVGSTASAQKMKSPRTVSATAERRVWVTNGLPRVSAFEDWRSDGRRIRAMRWQQIWLDARLVSILSDESRRRAAPRQRRENPVRAGVIVLCQPGKRPSFFRKRMQCAS